MFIFCPGITWYIFCSSSGHRLIMQYWTVTHAMTNALLLKSRTSWVSQYVNLIVNNISCFAILLANGYDRKNSYESTIFWKNSDLYESNTTFVLCVGTKRRIWYNATHANFGFSRRHKENDIVVEFVSFLNDVTFLVMNE